MLDQQKTQKEFAARWFEEVWNQSRREAIDELLPEDCVLHDGSSEYRGPDEFKRFYDAIRAQLSDVRVTPIEAFSEGDMVCMRWSSTATHTATGKPLQVTGISILRFKDGRFVEAWQNWDQYSLHQQLQEASPKSFTQAAG